MPQPQSFYAENSKIYDNLLKTCSKRIYIIGTLRLLTVVSAAFFTWFLWPAWGSITIALLGHFVLFAVLLKISSKLNFKKEYYQNRLAINQNELDGLNHNFSSFDGFKERIDLQHPFSCDLDIFGDNSLFQAVNRTQTNIGKNKLADWFEFPLTDKQEILNRRVAIQELTGNPELMLHFRATAMSCEGSESDVDALQLFCQSPDLIKGKKWWRLLSFVLPLSWIAFFILAGFGIIHWNVLPAVFVVALVVSYSLMKKVNVLNQTLEDKVKILSTYSSLLIIIEKQKFPSNRLSILRERLLTDKENASTAIHQLASYLRSLELRKTFPAGFLLNVLMLWEIKYALKIEDWKNKHAAVLMQWMNALADFDALCSLAAFAYNHPKYVYPEMTDTYFQFNARKLGHPLIRESVCVRNDIDIPTSAYFMIVTGANMAGKSTYLRTIGVNFLLGCLGAPVFADSMCFYPARLTSSLRTTDSLDKHESYFFAELKRLSNIITRLQNGEELFIILDEILKGTNSVDKQKGSRALIRQLLALNASGIVATHDLSLAALTDIYPKQIKNCCFEADIINDELFFSYKIQDGIARNMNACFLMKKMGIVVDEDTNKEIGKEKC